MVEMFSFRLMSMYVDYILVFIASSLYTTCVSVFSSISMIVCAYCWRHFTDRVFLVNLALSIYFRVI